MPTKKRPAAKSAGSSTGKSQICSVCHTELNDPAEWMRSKKKIYCSACYQGLLFPNRKLGSQEIID